MRKTTFSILFIIVVLLCFTSCYSVRIVSSQGTVNPDPMSERADFYRDKMIIELDTVVKASAFTDEVSFIASGTRCKSGKLHSVEYKNSFGASLLYLVTFGSRRKVKIKYVCLKTEN
ncbi:hypothetical protein [Aquimarina brevivitae]|uniref:Uncharacterized protein n=1 Tax=Aquimarina brevivitae TaxID=323412 RepID=A0A4Q7P2P5_9FLAO|nr:hypothetical protein [Aquimarina brevivitae]RZS93887.1 hypothetical protein EV197_2468 [Aquimarina brevivitae]